MKKKLVLFPTLAIDRKYYAVLKCHLYQGVIEQRDATQQVATQIHLSI
jgi:hypothetical protein